MESLAIGLTTVVPRQGGGGGGGGVCGEGGLVLDKIAEIHPNFFFK